MKRTVYLIVVAIALLAALGFAFWLLGGAIMRGQEEKPAQEQSQLQDTQAPSGETEETEPTEYTEADAPEITFAEEEPVPSESETQEQTPTESTQTTETEEPQVPTTQAPEPDATEAPDSTTPPFTFEGSGDENELPPIPFELG